MSCTAKFVFRPILAYCDQITTLFQFKCLSKLGRHLALYCQSLAISKITKYMLQSNFRLNLLISDERSLILAETSLYCYDLILQSFELLTVVRFRVMA